MRIGLVWVLVAFVGMALGCATPRTAGSAVRSSIDTGAGGSPAVHSEEKERRKPRVDISVFTGSRDLDEVEFDLNDSNFLNTDLEVERKRSGARFAFGGEKSRGFFEVFAEKLEGEFFGPVFDEFEAFGIGGGVLGAPRVNDATSELGYLIPYSARLAIVAGAEDVDTTPGNTAESVLAYLVE